MAWTDKPLQRIKDSRQYPIVEITWRDAACYGGWDWVAPYRKKGTKECRSVGRLIRADRKELVIVQSIDAEGRVSDGISIPRSWTSRVRRLRA